MNTVPKLEARVHPHRDLSTRPKKCLAFVDLTIGESFVIKGIRILHDPDTPFDKAFVVFPAQRGDGRTSDRWFDIAHPVTPEARTAAISLILAEYEKVRGDGRTP